MQRKKKLVKNFSVFGKLQQVQCDLRGAAKGGLGMRRKASLEGKHGLGRLLQLGCRRMIQSMTYE